MSHFSDSRDPAGIGYLILQDHGYKQEGAPDHARGSLVGVRVLGRRDGNDEDSRWKEDELARGPIGGGFFWARETTKAGSWQFGWPAVVADEGWVDPGGAGQGGRIRDADKGGGLKPRGRQPRPPATTNEKPPPEAKGNAKPAKKDLSKPENQKLIKGGMSAGSTRDKHGNLMVGAIGTPKAFAVGAGENAIGGWVGIGGAWMNAFPNAGAFGGFGNPNLGGGVPNVFGQGLQALQANFVQKIPSIWVAPGSKGDKWGTNKFFEVQDEGIFGIGVDAYNINAMGAASYRSALQKFGNKQDADDTTFYNFGPDSVSVSASSLTFNVFPGAREWYADGRFRATVPKTPSGWPDIPKGFVGKVEQASTEDSQDALWLHGDPRLVAVHKGNPFSCGSVVTDLTGDAFVDLSRGARLHSMLWVVKGPKQTAKPSNTLSTADREQLGMFEHYERVLGTAQAEEFVGRPKGGKIVLGDNKQNWLAWNIGPSGQRDTYGGLVIDVPDSETASASGRTLGVASARFGGPFDIGDSKDKHKWGVDKDGNRINALHLATLALFRERGSDKFDGPLNFEHAYPKCGDMDYPVRVHLGWDETSEMWSWWTTVPFTRTPGGGEGEVPPSRTPKEPIPKGPVTPPGQPPAPPGPAEPGWRDKQNPHNDANREPTAQQTRIVSHNEIGFPAVSFHAQEYIQGKPDFAHATNARSRDLAKYWKNTPMVGRLVAYG